VEAALRFGDTVAHLSGDEFAVLLEDIHSVQDAIFVAERIQQHLTLPFEIENQDFYISASIGIAKGAAGYDRPEDLLRDANTAMFRAKVQGRSRHELFDESMLTKAMALLPLEMSLRRAIENNELHLQYQPVYSLTSGKLEACEATLRWHHPERGIVYPEEFVSVVEESGMMAAVGEWMIQRAASQLHEWHKTNPELSLTVGITTSELLQRGSARALLRITEQSGVSPGKLELQISEGTLMQNTDKLAGLLEELREQGLQLCVSEYGTAHVSLEYLKRFRVNSLKLDRAFLHDVMQNTLEESVATAMITLAHSLQIRVVADGVENQEQLEFLRWHRCDAAQGEFLGVPLSAEDFIKLLLSPTS
jgi:EAL domain-containing protein (putative c-di-GMP-specific phosphodiesterase class I)